MNRRLKCLSKIQRAGLGNLYAHRHHMRSYWKTALVERFEKTIPAEVRKRIIFLPWLKDPADFISVIATTDVILDPFHFGIGSTAIMTFTMGTPLVTRAGEFMRGRVGTGFCKMMNLTECIAENTKAYARKAVMLARDQSLREKISTKIMKNNSILYESPHPIEDIVDFFRSATSSWHIEPGTSKKAPPDSKIIVTPHQRNAAQKFVELAQPYSPPH